MLAMILLVMPLLVAGITTPHPTEVTSDLIHTPTRVATMSYVGHAPFVISNDSALHNAALDESWPGSGTEAEPYIIEGYNITSDMDCFDFDDVSLYFEIRDCYLNAVTPDSGRGISMSNVSNGLVADTFIQNKYEGIRITGSSHNRIRNCTILLGSDAGIWVQQSNDTLIEESEVKNFESGIIIYETNFTTIMNSDIHDNVAGIGVVSSRNCTLEANDIHKNGPDGNGIYLMEVDYSSVISNTIHSNSPGGLYMLVCQFTNISDNHFYNASSYAIYLEVCENNTVKENNIHGNGWWPIYPYPKCGILLEESYDNVIEDNQIWNNTENGIYVDGANDANIAGNTIFNNTDFGIQGIGADNITVIGNEIYRNGWDTAEEFSGGILNSKGGDWLIEGNNVWNNSHYGITIDNCTESNTIIGNIIWNASIAGIYVQNSFYVISTENTVFQCQYGIQLASIWTNVTSNIIYDNEIGIYVQALIGSFIFDNDIGWNDANAINEFTNDDSYWHDNVSIGNWWHDYSGTGNYSIFTEFSTTPYDVYPQRNMNVTASTPNAHELISVGNEMIWPAFAHNPLNFSLMVNGSLSDNLDWDGNDITLNVDLFGVGYHELELVVYHVSGHSLSASSSVTVTDLTAPSWIVGPSDQQINEGDLLSVQFSAEDESGIINWWVNDTVNFHIDATGFLTNNTALTVGDYGLRVSVNDTFGNSINYEIRIRVLYVPPVTTTTTTTITNTTSTTTTPAPSPLDETTLMLLLGGGGLGVIIILVIMLRKRGG